MPETPDFDQIARRIVKLRADLEDEDMEASFVEQLRLVWNARGAADLDAVDARVRALVAGEVVGAGIARHVAEAVRTLDR